MRVSLPGYNALTDTNPDHFALYSDQEWVLIKENARGSISVGSTSTETVEHGLTYVPFYMVYAPDGTYENWLHGYNIYYDYKIWADEDYLYLRNDSGTARTFQYYIFYDQQV